MHGCTHLSRFALVSRVFPGRNAKKYTGYCIIACVLTCVGTPVIIQFGVSYRQVEVGAKWVQIELCKPYLHMLFYRVHPIGRCAPESALVYSHLTQRIYLGSFLIFCRDICINVHRCHTKTKTIKMLLYDGSLNGVMNISEICTTSLIRVAAA